LFYTLNISDCSSLHYVEDQELSLSRFSFSSEVSAAAQTSLVLSDAHAGRLSSNVSTPHANISFNQENGRWEVHAPLSEVNLIYRYLKFIPFPDYDHNFSLLLKADDGIQEVSCEIPVMATVVNDAPRFVGSLSPRSFDLGKSFELSVSSWVIDVEGDPITLSATLVNGSPLPRWLSFKNGVFYGAPGEGDVGSYEIKLTASDGKESTTENFIIQVVRPSSEDQKTPLGLIIGLSVGFIVLTAGVAIGWRVYKKHKAHQHSKVESSDAHESELSNPLKNLHNDEIPLSSPRLIEGESVPGDTSVGKAEDLELVRARAVNPIVPLARTQSHLPQHGHGFFSVTSNVSITPDKSPWHGEEVKVTPVQPPWSDAVKVDRAPSGYSAE